MTPSQTQAHNAVLFEGSAWSVRLQVANGVLDSIASTSDATDLMQDAVDPVFDIAMPLPDNPGHRLSNDANGVLVVEADELRTIAWGSAASASQSWPVSSKLEMRPDLAGGLSMRLSVRNDSPHAIPQVMFPVLSGLQAVGPPEQIALTLARTFRRPFVELGVSGDAVVFYDLDREWYFHYGEFEHALKWLDLGSETHGIGLYSQGDEPDLQGLSVRRTSDPDRLRVAWAHYPHIQPGETWTSPAFVLRPREQGWRETAGAYRDELLRRQPPSSTSAYLCDSPGFRSVFFPTYLYESAEGASFSDLVEHARDAKAHGIRELVVWFLFDGYFRMPWTIDSRLGSRADLRDAVRSCRELGVNVSAFLSVRGLRSADHNSDLFERDLDGKVRSEHWTYSKKFVPVMNPPYFNRDETTMACVASPRWQRLFAESCDELRQLDIYSICFDQMYTNRLCYEPSHGHAPQSTQASLNAALRQQYKINRRHDPDATLSGETVSDVTQAFQHYNWDWHGITDFGGRVLGLGQLEPLRYILPRFRLAAPVDNSPRWLLELFVRGLSVNFMPRHGEGRIGDDPAFSALVRRVSRYRRAWARFFEQGDYVGSFDRGAAVWSLYRRPDEALLLMWGGPDDDRSNELPEALARRFSPEDYPWCTSYTLTGRKCDARHIDAWQALPEAPGADDVAMHHWTSNASVEPVPDSDSTILHTKGRRSQA